MSSGVTESENANESNWDAKAAFMAPIVAFVISVWLAVSGDAEMPTLFAVLSIFLFAVYFGFMSNRVKKEKEVVFGVALILYSSIAMFWSAYVYQKPDLYWLFVPTLIMAIALFCLGFFSVSLYFDDSMVAKKIATDNNDLMRQDLDKIKEDLSEIIKEQSRISSSIQKLLKNAD